MLRFFFLCVLILTSTNLSIGQDRVIRITKLLNDQEYSALVSAYDELTKQETELNTIISDKREVLRDKKDIASHFTDEIIELEEKLFLINKSIRNLASRINSLEHEWTLGNINKNRSPYSHKEQNLYLSYNDYLKQNLSEEQYAMLLNTKTDEQEIKDVIKEIRNNYLTIKDLSEIYLSAEKSDAKAIFSEIERLQNDGKKLDSSLSSLSLKTFDTQTYLYNYILDKKNKTDIIAEMEREMMLTRSKTAEISGRYMYDGLASYPFKRYILLLYEKMLASDGELTSIVDSIDTEIYKLSNIDNYLLPHLEIEERSFIEYKDIEITSRAKYSATNPIPTGEIENRGSVYRILLGAYVRPQPISLFKNIYPLEYEQKSDSKYYYYAGSFRSYSEAESNLGLVTNRGFRRARVVGWIDGIYYDDVTLKNNNALNSSNKTPLYRVEITGGKDLDNATRELIEQLAPDKEITRTTNSEGRVIFSIGSFDSAETADSIAKQIMSLDSGFKATKTELF